ncbi:MAG TPA: hypothetical protein DIW64_11945 [Cellvibrio sp.]|nr:hypothetical protein [Cellvibrio sp.]
MEALTVGIILACVTAIFWAFGEISKDHRIKLQEVKPRIIEILSARVKSLTRGESSSNIYRIETEELVALCTYLPVMKKIRLKMATKQYSKAHRWELIDGYYYLINPQEMLSICVKILKILQ